MSKQFTQKDRFYELLADQHLEQLNIEDQHELDMLRQKLQLVEPNTFGEALVAFDLLADHPEEQSSLPERLMNSICTTGYSVLAHTTHDDSSHRQVTGTIREQGPKRILQFSMAAAVIIAGACVTLLVRSESIRSQTNQSFDQQIAIAQDREEELVEMLANAMLNLDEANQTIVHYQTPSDPTELLAKRLKLIGVPDTVQIAWAPFNQPGSLAEQSNIQGDVVWNDELGEGYLRFVGLKVNDPMIEQYQVWVIDERGLEQRVSGGVFNASSDGEVIVPIEPGIDLGRVALFAITIENPGGTWVSNLERRVVVAARSEG
ncbi:MAG: anti-sigma factor [Phycisphaerales bacterium]|nr:anti-sigma factor [Phycisphaerales bacterium]